MEPEQLMFPLRAGLERAELAPLGAARAAGATRAQISPAMQKPAEQAASYHEWPAIRGNTDDNDIATWPNRVPLVPHCSPQTLLPRLTVAARCCLT